MGLRLDNGVEVKVIDFIVNNETKVTTLTVAPKDPDDILREGGSVSEHSFTITAPSSMVGSTLKDAYSFTKKLPMYKGAKNT